MGVEKKRPSTKIKSKVVFFFFYLMLNIIFFELNVKLYLIALRKNDQV